MGLMVEIWGVDRKILYYEGSYNESSLVEILTGFFHASPMK